MRAFRSSRRVGVRTLVYTLVVSSVAVMVSLAIVNLLRPGEGVDPAIARELLAGASEGARAIVRQSGESASGMDALVNIIPSNIVAAMSANDILAVMFFALFFGIGLVLVQTPNSRTLKDRSEEHTSELQSLMRISY